MQAFYSLVEEKVQPDDSVMEGMAMRPIDPEDMGAAGAFFEIGEVVFGELLAQVNADHLKFCEIAHVRVSTFPDIPLSPATNLRQPIIRP